MNSDALNARVIENLEAQVSELRAENAALGGRVERAWSRVEHTSYCNALELEAKELELELDVDFDAHTLSGTATTTFEVIAEGVDKVLFDTRDLDVRAVRVDGAVDAAPSSCCRAARPTPTSSPSATRYASRFRPPPPSARVEVSVDYTPRPTPARAVAPAGTDRRPGHPHLFTQCQAIHARSLLPCFDTPGAKVTYRASITAPAWSQALMSAVLQEPRTGAVVAAGAGTGPGQEQGQGGGARTGRRCSSSCSACRRPPTSSLSPWGTWRAGALAPVSRVERA